ncbi:MAG: PorP/SprF family type IX secretion system membrane protein [Dinghuibacter sp.]|nr:PorP/SprF family type IX secretion system membrane protein [Dinghuibacter sp.]
MKYIYIIAFIVVFILTGTGVNAQDPLFSQYYHTPLYSNPAFCGTGKNAWRFTGALRFEWVRIPSTMRTISLGAEKQIRDINAGVGLLLNHNNEGFVKRNSIHGIYCQGVDLSERSSVYLAAQYGLVWRNVDLTDFLFADQIDRFGPNPYIVSGIESTPSGGDFFSDVSGGLVFTYNNIMLGAAAQHFYNTDQGMFGDQGRLLKPRFTAHFNLLLDTDEYDEASLKIKPAVIYNTQGSSKSLLAGTLMTIRGGWVEIGAWYHNNLSVQKGHRFSVGANFKLGQYKHNYNGDPVKNVRAGVLIEREIANGLGRRTLGSLEMGGVYEVNTDSDCPKPYKGGDLRKYPWAFQ